ncbi:SHO1 [Candida pseudojiufengensis]|uniref:SHO1 n=1 Tax=Candida pseudojiufengensis TaxID=497109 RepID=UPI002224694D|nr:SHO1 [Candida pseudojiufengensis]KAI5961433.1 SHO1 [Candida pseudojiufengensis]
MGFRIQNFIGDPFAISTVSFGLISWIISLGGAAASDQSRFPHFTWWGIAYQIVIILVIFILYSNNNIELYKFTLVGLVSVAFIYTTNSTNNLIYNSFSSGNLCCAAGCILLSILNLIWILYFGGHPESPTNQFIDSFSYKNNHHHEQLGNNINNNNSSSNIIKHESYIDETTSQDRRYISPMNLPQQDQMRHLSGPATTASTTNNNRQSVRGSTTNSTNIANAYIQSQQLSGVDNNKDNTLNNTNNTNNTTRDLTSNKRTTMYTDSETNTGITFRYKAKALYSYDANPEDLNEISFVKDEILEVDDIDGKWWQARRSNGQVGICPSNYVKLIES